MESRDGKREEEEAENGAGDLGIQVLKFSSSSPSRLKIRRLISDAKEKGILAGGEGGHDEERCFSAS